MASNLLIAIQQQNPWLISPQPIVISDDYIPRLQFDLISSPDWDNLWIVLTGPRQVGKTTIGKHYWRTKAGAEVDFILKTDFETIIPIEVKYRNLQGLQLSRSYKSFLEAYTPKHGFVITKNEIGQLHYQNSEIYFVPLENLTALFEKI